MSAAHARVYALNSMDVLKTVHAPIPCAPAKCKGYAHTSNLVLSSRRLVVYKKFTCQENVVVLANFPVLLKMYQVGKQYATCNRIKKAQILIKML